MRSNMTSKIEIAEGKTLKLNNTLCRDIGPLDDTGMQKILHMLDSYVKTKKLNPYGPLIVTSKTAFSNGVITQTGRILVQLREVPESLEPPYSFTEMIRIENCVLARYRGNTANLPLAYGKIQVHAFENDIRLKEETYTVFVEENENGIMADVFAETIP